MNTLKKDSNESRETRTWNTKPRTLTSQDTKFDLVSVRISYVLCTSFSELVCCTIATRTGPFLWNIRSTRCSFLLFWRLSVRYLWYDKFDNEWDNIIETSSCIEYISRIVLTTMKVIVIVRSLQHSFSKVLLDGLLFLPKIQHGLWFQHQEHSNYSRLSLCKDLRVGQNTVQSSD